MERLLLTHWRAPGDIVCMTACVRDLALNYPGRYEIHVAGTCPALWENNPHVAKVWGLRPPRGIPRYLLNCRDALAESGRKRMHYITAFHRDLGRQLGIPVPTLQPKGDLHLSEAERVAPPVAGHYWVIIAGGKADIPAKVWATARFQRVVSILRKEGVRCVQGGTLLPGHWHPELRDVDNFVGETDLRGFIRLIHHAAGVVCPPSLSMHVAAALDKPCVVIAGSREPWWWEAYVNPVENHFGQQCVGVTVPHRYLHTIGRLPCCESSGCWKSHTDPGKNVRPDSQCVSLVDDGCGQVIPRCLDLIAAEEVVAAVLSYQEGGSVGDAEGITARV